MHLHLPTPLRSTSIRLALLGVLALACAGLAGTPQRSSADVQASIAAKQDAASALRAQVDADSAQIAHTDGGLAVAQARLSQLQSAVSARESELATVQRSLIVARNHLVDLENRLQAASQALAGNLVGSYEGDKPDALTVVLEAHGFSDLLERLSFLQAMGRQDANVVTDTRTARADVTREAQHLGALELRDQRITHQLVGQRNQASVLQAALLHVEIQQVSHRAHDAAALSAVQGQVHALEAQQAAVERAQAAANAEAAANGPAGQSAPGTNGIQIDTGGMVQAPAGAPAAVAQVIAAGNAIATLPYVYGGGHASFHADAYDCSGSVSYALAAAGLVSSPLDSTAFESWGEPGPGKWITVYANAGHAFMYVAGWRFDTVALAEGGTRWSSSPTDTSGFVARHPPGL